MQTVSASYNPYVPEIVTDASVEFSLIDVDASKVASSSGSAAVDFTSIAQTHNDIIRNTLKIADFETNLWALDGSFVLPSTQGNGETGWFSNAISNSSGTINVSLTYNFSTPQSSAGFTVIFDTRSGECASDFSVTTYNGSTIIGTVSITGNEESKVFVDLPSYGYNKVVIRFTKTSKPYRRVRLTELVFGQTVKFTSDKIKEMRILREASRYGEKLPASMLQITIDNSDAAYNVLNPTGIYRYLQEGQGLTASITLNGEVIDMGKFYFETASANNDALTATITAYDLLWRLGKSTYNKGTTGTWTVQQAVDDILADAGLSNVTTNIPEENGSILINKCIPLNTTHRDALRMVSQCSKSTFYIDRQGVLVAKDWTFINSVASIKPSNMRGFGDGIDIGMINRVELRQDNSFAGTSTLLSAHNENAGEPLQALTITNPLPTSNIGTATRILNRCTYRNIYTIPVQSNPALDLLDPIRLENTFGVNERCILLKTETVYDGSIMDNITAIAWLPTPKLLSVSNVADGVKVEWQRVAGAAEYRIYYKPPGGSWTTAGYTNGTVVSYVVTGLQPNTEYTFSVRCITRDHGTNTSYYDTKGLTITTGG